MVCTMFVQVCTYKSKKNISNNLLTNGLYNVCTCMYIEIEKCVSQIFGFQK